MSQIIVTSRYLKSGTDKNKRKNYTRYIATRETVEVYEQNKIDREAPATEKQQELLSDLLADFPEAKKYLEYDDYNDEPTVENASELISAIIERNADVIGNRQNFVGYMAMRPGVEKRGAHGLFNDKDEPIILNQAADEVANHPGNVWSHVVSLRREDAIRLGYDNSERWRDLVKRHISDISEAQRIPLCNLNWYAAFHDTTHHPHIHLLVYSANPKQGFLTKQGIDKIRSVFANDIFYDELQSVYQEQTVKRDELKAESKKYVENLLKEIADGGYENAELEKLIRTLYSQLEKCKGKRVYGYLPPEVKESVNAIFKEISKDKNIQSLYEKWCELERQKYKTYTQKEKEFPSLYENKVFHSIKNNILRQVLNMNSLNGFEDYIEPEPIEITNDADVSPQIDDNISADDFNWSDDTVESHTADFESESKYYIKWMKSAEQGQPYAAYAAAQMYNKGEYVSKDEGQSQKYYKQALIGFLKLEADNRADDNLYYKIGIMYKNGQGAQKDMIKAIDYFKRSAELNNMNAKRTLALEYLSGEHPEQDIDKGLAMLTECADSGDTLSCYKLGKIYLKGEIAYKDSDMAEKYLLKAAEEENEYALYSLGKLYLEEEKYSLDKAVEYLEKAVRYDEIRPYAAYSLAKILLDNNPYHDSVKAVSLLKSAAMENEWASFLLGRLYLYGTDDIPKNKEEAEEWLTMSASQGNEYAQNMINNIHSFENAALANTICSLFVYLSRCIADDYDQKFKSNKMSADRKLKRMIQQKKQALGLKEEHLQNQELY